MEPKCIFILQKATQHDVDMYALAFTRGSHMIFPCAAGTSKQLALEEIKAVLHREVDLLSIEETLK